MRKKRLFGLSLAFVAMVGFVSVACNEGGDSPTSPVIVAPDPSPSGGSSNAPAAGQPQNVAETPATEDPGHPEVIYQNWQFKILNPTNHPVIYRLCTFQITGNGATIHNQIYLGQTNNVEAPKQSDGTVIPWNINSFDVECGQSFKVQVDPWKGGSDCPTDAYSIDERGTFLDVTTSDCECVEEWIEQEPEVDGEWGECEPVPTIDTIVPPQCARSRIKTVTIYEINSCTEEKRIKSQEETEETEPCDCLCVEEGPFGPEDFGDVTWRGDPIEGRCPETFSVRNGRVCYEHQFGDQPTRTTYTCQEPELGSREVCRDWEVDCPPVCARTPATSSASQPFTLPNSGQATETNWVNTNVDPGPYVFGLKTNFSQSGHCTVATVPAKVVLLKAGTNYWYFLNVFVGQPLCSGGQGVSHVSYFRCPPD